MKTPELKKPVKVLPVGNVENVLYPEWMELEELGDGVFLHIKEQAQESITGPRTYEEVLALDGAIAFANSVRKVLGEEISTAIPGYMPNVMSIESQDLVYEYTQGRFTEEDLCNVNRYPENELENIGLEFLDFVPRDVNAAREQIARDVCAVAPIVGVTASEVSAVMGVVRLRRKGKIFGEAHLSEDEDTGNFVLMVKTIKKHEKIVKELIKETEAQIRANSMYRGKAYDYSNKKFISDLAFDTADRIVLASRLTKRIRSKIANKINGRSKNSLTTNRYYLASGEPGTGKTECARALGAYAVANRLTFLTYMPTKVDVDELKRFLEFANKVGPSLVVIEDVEKMIGADKAAYSQMLEIIDGVASKSRKLHVWFTTNHASVNDNQFTEKFLRRMNAILNFDVRNAATIQGLFAVYMPDEWDLSKEISYENDMLHKTGRADDSEFSPHPKMVRLIEFCVDQQFKPWAIKATIDNAIDYWDDDQSVHTPNADDLLYSAEEILDQINLAKSAPKEKVEDGLESRHRQIAREEFELMSK